MYKNGHVIYAQRRIAFSRVTTSVERHTEKIEMLLNSLILDVVNQTLDARLPLNVQQKKALSLLRKSLGSGEQPRLIARAA